MLLTYLLACKWFLAPDPLDLAPPSEPRTPPSPVPDRGERSLVRMASEATFSLPDANRPGGADAPQTIELIGSFSRDSGGRDGQQIWAIDLPIHDNLLPTRTEGTHFFGTECPPGLEVVGPDGPLKFRRFGRAKPDKIVFGFDREHLYIGQSEDLPAPDPSDYTLTFPTATAAENAFNFGTSGLSPDAFVARTQTVGEHSHAGLYLPAPATAEWTVEVPDDGMVGFRATVFPPAIASREASDGARVLVEVEVDGQVTEAAAEAVAVGSWSQVRADVSAFAGREVTLRFRTDPGATPTFDYVFLEGPTLYPRTETPRRFVLVFVDTLRPDHLGMYGYERPTSPNLDDWASHGVRFTNARSVAPWTLPSARTMLTGRQPELFYEGQRLQDHFAEAGWRTDAFLTNAFLSQPFEIHLGWDHFHYEHLGDATDVVARAVDAIEAWPQRDTLTMVHFMEAHLPYRESRYHRMLFEGSRPDELDHLTRKFLVTVDEETDNRDGIIEYVTARYDQNIRAVDDALAPLLEAAGPDATVVLVSDHGEELWDHDGFEHGHSFYDELLRVPLVVRSPNLPAGVVDAPVSLLDVSPTLLELAGLSPDDAITGTSLVPVAWGDGDVADTLHQRPHGFGRPLYGEDGWGVVTGDRKFWETHTSRHVFDLATDPGEKADQYSAGDDVSAYRQALGEALGRPVRRAWRISLTSPTLARTQHIRWAHPEGISDVALAYDPRGRLDYALPELVDGVAHVTVPPNEEVPEELLLYLASDETPIEGLEVRFDARVFRCPRPRNGSVLCLAGGGEQRMVVEEAWAPVPRGVEVSGFHPDVEQQLRELGYLDD